MGKRLLRIFWFLLVCTIWCQSLGTSILALGWSYRWVRHRISQGLFRLSPMAEKTSWQQFASNLEQLTPVRDSPNLNTVRISTFIYWWRYGDLGR